MNKHIKKLLCAAVSLAMVSGTVMLPMTASADATPIFDGDTVEKEWKFDFGATGTAAEEGWTAVTPDMHYTKTGTAEFGFLGTDENDWQDQGDRYDGFGTQKKQMANDDNKVISLKAGGGTGLEDGIGSTGEDLYGNAGDIYYPVRFALRADDDAYYRVRATVTTLDPTQDAEISLYTERKHPLFTDTTVAAGKTKTVEFSVRPTPIYYQKSNPTGPIKDEMVNVCAVGKNSAIASIEIQKVQEYPVFWVLGDSTVTDGNCLLPFFRLQNYTGVGTGLTKYLPRDLAMVNEGEGGLDAKDSLHFNMVKDRIKAGDYLYVEYGHNHKTDGTTGYKGALPKYYDLCTEKGANLIIVSPIERINQWDSATSKYTHSLDGFATAGKEYVEEKIAAGATNIAYVELNQYSLDFYNRIVAENGNDPNAIKFYFQTAQGGGTDTTHPNDAGAENLAYEFIKAAQARAAAGTTSAAEKTVLESFLGTAEESKLTGETPNLVPESITSGKLGGDAWPQYVSGPEYTYPTDIESITVADGKIKDMTVNVIGSMSTYALGVVDVYDAVGEKKASYVSSNNVDNSTGKGLQTVAFPDTAVLADGDTFKAYTWTAKGDVQELLPEEEGGVRMSAEYDYIPESESLIKDNFEYADAQYDGDEDTEEPTLIEAESINSGWTFRGSAEKTTTLGVITSGGDEEGAEPEKTYYANAVTTGKKPNNGGDGSFYLSKDLAHEIGTSGKYEVSFDIKYVTGGGMNVQLVADPSASNAGGTAQLPLFSVDAEGTITSGGKTAGQVSSLLFAKVRYILDMDLGTATLYLAGYDPITYDIANYTTTDINVTPAKLTSLMFTSSKVAAGIQISNLNVAALEPTELPEYTASVTSSNDGFGTVTITKAEVADGGDADLSSVDADVTLSYNFDSAVITSDKAAEMTLIEAKYDENGKLKSAKATPVKFEEAGTQMIKAAAGSTLMLWDSLGGMEPLTPAITAADGETKSVTAEMNTVVTATATANDGYVFMGWYNEGDTSNVVSMDSPYSFRLRGDTSLTARFVIKPEITDIKNYTITAASGSIKSTAGTTVQMGIADAVDEFGTPVSQAKASDFTWTSSDPNITVSADGLVTVGENYTLDGDTAEVTITASINGVDKTFKLTVFGYEYYEAMAKETTKYEGEFVTIAGKEAIVFPGANTKCKYTMTAPVTLDRKTTVSYEHAWSGYNTCEQLRTLNFLNSDGTTIFSLCYSWGDLFAGAAANADAKITGAVQKDKWTTVTAVIDPDTSTVTVTVGENSATTTLAADAKDIAGISFDSAASVPGPTGGDKPRPLGISSITIKK